MVGIVFDSLDVRGELRTTFEVGTTDRVRWFDLDEIANLPHVELVDFVVDLLAYRSNPSVPEPAYWGTCRVTLTAIERSPEGRLHRRSGGPLGGLTVEPDRKRVRIRRRSDEGDGAPVVREICAEAGS
jgi:hypothetical protein